MYGQLALRFLEESFAVCRLPGNDGLPSWCIPSRDLLAYLRAPDETTVICEERLVPPGVRAERGFAVLKVDGPLPFEAVGILARLSHALSRAAISILAVSTFETDYVLVRREHAGRAAEALRAAGCVVSGVLTSDAPNR